VFRLHELLEYIDDDQDNRFPSIVWQELNKLEDTDLIPTAWFPPDDGIPGNWLTLTPMVTNMAQQ
jgi:hypothetical protein